MINGVLFAVYTEREATPEEFINWHPVGGISWEERARHMKAAGITDPEANPVSAIAVSG